MQVKTKNRSWSNILANQRTSEFSVRTSQRKTSNPWLLHVIGRDLGHSATHPALAFSGPCVSRLRYFCVFSFLYVYLLVYFWLNLIEGYLTGEGCTEKCSLITSDENQNNIPYLSDDVIKPVTSLMSLLSGTVSYHMPSLKSEVSEQGGCFGDFLKHEELSKKRKITKGEHKSWRTVGEIKSALTWFVFKQKPGWSQLQWQEIFQCPSQCNQTVGTDALRLHWERPSGCGLICGDSFGKQFHFPAVYWK